MKRNNWIFCVFLAVFYFFSYHPTTSASENIPRISINFSNTDLTTCIATILKLADSPAQVTVQKNITTHITKSIEKKRWDLALKEILAENDLLLKKQMNGTYLITKIIKEKTSPSDKNGTITLSEESLNLPKAQQECPPDSLITLGYKYSTGANPFSLIGKCVKLKNVTPFQYMGARKALVTWSYRGGNGTVLAEDRSKAGTAINNSRFLVGTVTGTYEYITVSGAAMVIPHLIIK
jgi:hypothetical protein